MVYLDARHTKDEFSAEMDERIAIRGKLLGFYEGTYIKVLEKFDGKVLNARFLKALREEASSQSQMLSVSEMHADGSFAISMRRDRWNYNDCESLYVKCVTGDDGRIDASASLEDRTAKAWLSGFKDYIGDYRRSKEQYEEFMKVGKAMVDAVNAWNALPGPFRNEFDKRYMSIY